MGGAHPKIGVAFLTDPSLDSSSVLPVDAIDRLCGPAAYRRIGVFQQRPQSGECLPGLRAEHLKRKGGGEACAWQVVLEQGNNSGEIRLRVTFEISQQIGRAHV